MILRLFTNNTGRVLFFFNDQKFIKCTDFCVSLLIVSFQGCGLQLKKIWDDPASVTKMLFTWLHTEGFKESGQRIIFSKQGLFEEWKEALWML